MSLQGLLRHANINGTLLCVCSEGNFQTFHSHLVPLDEFAALLQRFVDVHGFQLQRVDSRLGPGHDKGFPARVPTPKPRLRRLGTPRKEQKALPSCTSSPRASFTVLLLLLFPGRGLIETPSEEGREVLKSQALSLKVSEPPREFEEHE